MIRKPSCSALAAISLLCVVLLAACSSGKPFVTNVIIAPTSASIDAAVITTGDTQQFTATGLYSDGTKQDVTALTQWTSSNVAVASIDGTGLATAGNPPDTATATITGSIGGHSSAATLTVVHGIVSIAVAPLAVSVAVGTPQSFTATGTYSNMAGGTHTESITSIATWNSATPATATINGSGVATTLAAGTTNITASIGTVTSTPVAVLTVTAAGPIGLKLSPANPTIAIGNSTNLTALVLNSDSSTSPLGVTAVTWATSGCTPAGAVLIAPTVVNGNEAGSGRVAGSCTVTATQGTLTGSTTVTVVTGSSHFAYVANTGDPDIGGFSVSASSATPLTALTPATTPVPTDAQQVVLNPNGQYAYLIDSSGVVHVYTISSAGTLALPTEPGTLPSVSSAGSTLNYGVVDPTGRFLFATDLDGHALHSAAISTVDGTLGTVSQVTGIGSGAGVGPESVAIDRTGQYAYVVSDNDTIYAYTINQTDGTLQAHPTNPTYALPGGSGPLAITVDSSNSLVYTANAGNNTVSVFTLDSSSGVLTSRSTFTVTGAVFVDNLIVDPTSKFLYVLDGGDGVANGAVYGFNIAGPNGAIGTSLANFPAATEVNPLGIAIDPTGTLIAVDNNVSASISVFKLTGGALATPTPAPVPAGFGPLFITLLNAP